MSLILEALRKSEQQRRMGEAPTLGSESAWASRRLMPAYARRGRWLWAGALIVLLAGAAAAAWYYGRPSVAPIDATLQQPPVAAAAPPASPTVTAPAAATAAPAAPVASAPIAEPLATQTPAATVAIQPPTDAVLAAADPRETTPATAQDPQTVAAGDPQLLPPPANVATAPLPLPDPAPAVAVQPPAAPDAEAAAPVEAPVATQTPAPAAPVAAVAPPPTVQPPTAERPQGDLPYVYELPLPTRQTLPAMQVTMHVWNADPTRRFVILDGVRAGEGEAAGDNLTVLEIRREGVVLDYRGSRFLLPNGGY